MDIKKKAKKVRQTFVQDVGQQDAEDIASRYFAGWINGYTFS